MSKQQPQEGLLLTTTIHLNPVPQKILTNVDLQKAIQNCLTIEMSTLFGLFYKPQTRVLKIQKKNIVLEFTSQMFIFQDFDIWFEQKRSKLQEIWKNWSGNISYADLYFAGRYYDADLQTLNDLNMSVNVSVQGQLKQIQLKERKVNFIQQISQKEQLISPHFVLKSYTVDAKNHQRFNLHVLTEKNSLWLDNLIRLDINYQLPISKMMYQSFNLLHFLEHCLLGFSQDEVKQLKIRQPNGSTNQYGGLCLTVILPVECLEQFKDMFLKRQKSLYSKLEADRIVQEMYQVCDYQSCLLGGLGFLHNNDLLKTSFNWNSILYDLYSQLDVVDSFVQVSCNCDLDVQKLLKTVKQITTLPSPRESHIQKYFQSFGKFNTLPIFKYDTIIRVKKSVLKAEDINYVQNILAQDKQYIYMLRYQFEDINRQQAGKSLDTDHIFNPFQRFFDFAALQLQWIQINPETIQQMQYETLVKNKSK